MIDRSREWWVANATAETLLLLWLCWVGLACGQQRPQSTVIELKFTEMSDTPPFKYTFRPDKDGNISAPGKIVMQLKGAKLRVDTNGDRLIDDQDAPPVDISSDVNHPTHLTVRRVIGGKKVDYPFVVVLLIDDNERLVRIRSAAMLEGKFADYTVHIFDDNVDGAFANGFDRLAIYRPGRDSPDASRGLPWAPAAAIGPQLYHLELLADGAQLKLTPYTGPLAQVQVLFNQSVPGDNTRITLREENWAQFAACKPGETVRLVPGQYRLFTLTTLLGPGRNPPTGFSACNDPKTPPLEVKAGKSTLTFGPPLAMAFTAVREGSMIELTTVKITGVAGELYAPDTLTDQDAYAWYIKAAGKEMELAKLSFG